MSSTTVLKWRAHGADRADERRATRLGRIVSDMLAVRNVSVIVQVEEKVKRKLTYPNAVGIGALVRSDFLMLGVVGFPSVQGSVRGVGTDRRRHSTEQLSLRAPRLILADLERVP